MTPRDHGPGGSAGHHPHAASRSPGRSGHHRRREQPEGPLCPGMARVPGHAGVPGAGTGRRADDPACAARCPSPRSTNVCQPAYPLVIPAARRPRTTLTGTLIPASTACRASPAGRPGAVLLFGGDTSVPAHQQGTATTRPPWIAEPSHIPRARRDAWPPDSVLAGVRWQRLSMPHGRGGGLCRGLVRWLRLGPALSPRRLSEPRGVRSGLPPGGYTRVPGRCRPGRAAGG